jgi:hypothetical protein
MVRIRPELREMPQRDRVMSLFFMSNFRKVNKVVVQIVPRLREMPQKSYRSVSLFFYD